MRAAIFVVLALLVITVTALAFLAYCSGFRCLEPSPPLPMPRMPTHVPPVLPTEPQADISAPILLVPGLVGSWTRDDGLLHRSADIKDLDSWVLAENRYGMFVAHVFGHLKARLTAKGYRPHADLFDAPYDWRRPATDHRAIMDWIASAKAEFKRRRGREADRVDVVAHSLGGLVVRSYVQSDAYRDDVRNLAIVATPHFGAPEAYFTWAGGRVPPTKSRYFAAFLQKHLGAMNAFLDPQPGRTTTMFVRQYIQSLRDLLPVAVTDASSEGFLFGWPRADITPFSEMSDINRNQFLADLNRAMPALAHRASVHLFVATGVDTLQQIRVQATTSAAEWEDGEPVPTSEGHRFTATGDGTVALTTRPIEAQSAVSTKTAGHQEAVCVFTPEILGFLAIPVTVNDRCHVDREAPGASLAFGIATSSSARLTVTTPGGKFLDYYSKEVTGLLERAWMFFILDQPADGVYEVNVAGKPGDHYVSVNYLKNPLTNELLEGTTSFVVDTVETWRTSLTADRLTRLSVTRRVVPPEEGKK